MNSPKENRIKYNGRQLVFRIHKRGHKSYRGQDIENAFFFFFSCLELLRVKLHC